MGLFSLTQELAIDLGTANTLIIYNGKVVVDEPSIVALDVHTGKVVAIGHQARQMHEKTNPNIKTIRPLKDGVIADFNATELMLRGMIKKVKTSGSLFAPSLRMLPPEEFGLRWLQEEVNPYLRARRKLHRTMQERAAQHIFIILLNRK